MPAVNAASISAAVLPTPEKTIRAGSPPAAITRASSPPETMSKPLPRRARMFEHSEVGIRLDRVADEVGHAREGARRTPGTRLRARRASRRSRACRSARRCRTSGTPSAWSSPATDGECVHGLRSRRLRPPGRLAGRRCASDGLQARRRMTGAPGAAARTAVRRQLQRPLDAAGRERRGADRTSRHAMRRADGGRRIHVTSNGIVTGNPRGDHVFAPVAALLPPRGGREPGPDSAFQRSRP